MPTLPATSTFRVPGLATVMLAVPTLSIMSWPAYICCERAMDFGAAGAAATASVFDESQAERPTTAKRPAARITLRMDILPESLIAVRVRPVGPGLQGLHAG